MVLHDEEVLRRAGEFLRITAETTPSERDGLREWYARARQFQTFARDRSVELPHNFSEQRTRARGYGLAQAAQAIVRASLRQWSGDPSSPTSFLNPFGGSFSFRSSPLTHAH
jgi:hypothetical protein